MGCGGSKGGGGSGGKRTMEFDAVKKGLGENSVVLIDVRQAQNSSWTEVSRKWLLSPF